MKLPTIYHKKGKIIIIIPTVLGFAFNMSIVLCTIFKLNLFLVLTIFFPINKRKLHFAKQKTN